MSYILTLVSGNRTLSDTHVEICKRFLGSDKGSGEKIFNSEPVWLDPDKAIDLFIAQKPQRSQLTSLRKELAKSGIDSFIIPETNRQKKILIADMDSTFLSCETLDELASALDMKDKVSQITDKAMRGELDFHAAIKERVALLQNLEEEKVISMAAEMNFNPGAQDIIKTLKEFEVITILVSGGFTHFAEWAADKCGFDHVHSNKLEIKDGLMTGKVHDPILDADTKRDLVVHYARIYGFDVQDTMAVGDGANDIKMLKTAGLGVGYNPKPKVAKTIPNNIYQTDLMSLAYIQGYKSRDIIRR